MKIWGGRRGNEIRPKINQSGTPVQKENSKKCPCRCFGKGRGKSSVFDLPSLSPLFTFAVISRKKKEVDFSAPLPLLSPIGKWAIFVFFFCSFFEERRRHLLQRNFLHFGICAFVFPRPNNSRNGSPHQRLPTDNRQVI